jgi:hypothetical protein
MEEEAMVAMVEAQEVVPSCTETALVPLTSGLVVHQPRVVARSI